MFVTSRAILAICLGQPIDTGVSYRIAHLGAVVAFALLCGLAQAPAQTPAAPGADAALTEDIVIGSRILADFGVLDGFGHVSARDPKNPNQPE